MLPNFLQRLIGSPRRDGAAHIRSAPLARARDSHIRERESQHWLPLDRATTEVKELNSLEEEVEAFLLMGRPDMAATLLRHRIDEQTGASAHVWLSLLDILRTQGFRLEFEQRALEMKAAFNIELPRWEDSDIPFARGLEEAPHVLDKVLRHWNNPGCLGYLQGLVRDIRDGSRAGFRPETFRDLVLLIGVLERRSG
jgi:hypothetical protein